MKTREHVTGRVSARIHIQNTNPLDTCIHNFSISQLRRFVFFFFGESPHTMNKLAEDKKNKFVRGLFAPVESVVCTGSALDILMRQAVGNKRHPSRATRWKSCGYDCCLYFLGYSLCDLLAANLLLPGAYLLGFVALVCCLGLRVFAPASWPPLLVAFPSLVSRLDRLLCL